jgi:hypothetical protein
MFAVMKTFVTVISASTGRNDFIFDIWLWHGDLYRVSPFQVYRTSDICYESVNGRTDEQGDCNIAPTLNILKKQQMIIGTTRYCDT